MIIRPDVDEFFYKTPGNDRIFSYSSRAGYFDTAQNLTNLPSPQLMDTLWNAALNTPITGIPAVVQSDVKVYQGYYYLNAPKFQ